MRYFIEVNIVCKDTSDNTEKRVWKKVKPSNEKPYSFETLLKAKNTRDLFYPEKRYGDDNTRITDENGKIYTF